MKKTIFAAIALVLVGAAAQAGAPVYTDDLVDNAGLSYSANFDVDLNNKAGSAVNQLSMQATISSASVTATNFTDGSKSTASITVSNYSQLGINPATNTVTVGSTASLAPTKASASITISSNSALSDAYLVFNGHTYLEGRDWFKAATATGTALSLLSTLSQNSIVTFSTSGAGAVISGTATVTGPVGNTYTLYSSTPTALAISSAAFSGGANDGLLGAILTVNGKPYANGISWNSFDPVTGVSVSTRAAASIATLLGKISGISASAVSSVVYATATVAGSVGNTYTMSSNKAGLVVGGANFSAGRDTASITIDGVVLTNGVEWSAGASSVTAAKSISDAIVADPTLSTVMVSTWSGNVVFATSTITGTAANFSLSSLTSAIAVVGFTGGGPSNIDLAANTITVAGNALTTGRPVLYTKSAGTDPTPLAAGTTYYPIVVTAGSAFQLSYTSTGALAGLPIDLTAAATGGTFALTPLALTGSPSFKWQLSNDGSNFIDINVSSVTFSSPYTSTSTYWDFGQVNMRYLRLKFTGPTTGGVSLSVKPNGKG